MWQVYHGLEKSNLRLTLTPCGRGKQHQPSEHAGLEGSPSEVKLSLPLKCDKYPTVTYMAPLCKSLFYFVNPHQWALSPTF